MRKSTVPYSAVGNFVRYIQCPVFHIYLFPSVYSSPLGEFRFRIETSALAEAWFSSRIFLPWPLSFFLDCSAARGRLYVRDLLQPHYLWPSPGRHWPQHSLYHLQD